jgi:hypothetical protein
LEAVERPDRKHGGLEDFTPYSDDTH